MQGMSDRGGRDPFTLRFLDRELESRFQTEEGAAGLRGYRIITAATVLLWSLAAFLFPLGSAIPVGLSSVICLTMAAVGAVAFAVGSRASTMNRQHAVASSLTTANGLAVLYLMVAGDQVGRFAVAALLLIFMFGFVSRTRFVYALFRTVAVLVGFLVVLITYDGTDSLVIDTFVLVAASGANLLGLRLLERDRRIVWHQDLVIDEQAASIEVERAESERLLLNILPATVSQRLRRGEGPIADDYEEVSVLFADIVDFTEKASGMSAAEVVSLVGGLFSMFDEMVIARGVEKVKTIGDAYMVVAGVPEPMEDHAAKLIDLGLEMVRSAGSLAEFPDIALRVGIHSGPVTGGVVGTQKFAFDIWGNTVNVAARIEKAGAPGRVHVSELTSELAGDRYRFEPVAALELKGLRRMRTCYVVEDPADGADPADSASSGVELAGS